MHHRQHGPTPAVAANSCIDPKVSGTHRYVLTHKGRTTITALLAARDEAEGEVLEPLQVTWWYCNGIGWGRVRGRKNCGETQILLTFLLTIAQKTPFWSTYRGEPLLRINNL
jgi:hypothetical protein